MVIFVYGFIAFTIYLSFTDSRMLPSFGWVGWENYDRLFRIREWDVAVTNLAIFASLYIVICTIIGLCSRSSSTRRSAARASSGRSSSIPWRSRSS
jgi:ABC-type sugar transport system permease subunit